ncbi:DUF6153 family protein [Streptomyces sp. MCA2]|uniref:DUF6153 family protein n=1 Tax=Streptomyces sp. MCA2 TaxID=2944805 RepID=UPI002021DDF0|nr:DUF6153 family protein [Streptomyces sp. MCA2]MCL7496515.1 DUF6153 family protein [Streptomyces sp. MCA2]
MSTSRTSRAAGAWGHLLLIVVLALGVFVMHSVGHPDDSSGATMGPAVHGPAAGALEHRGMTASKPAAASVSSPGASDDAKPSSHTPGTGMDMTTLCVAVLGALVLISLLRAALSRRTDWLVRLRAGVVATLRPNPPPRRPPDLAQLSVLRI